MKHFDIYLTVHFMSYEMPVLKRVLAEDYDAAVVAGFCKTIYNLSDSEVAEILADEIADEIEDGEMTVKFENAVELFEVPVTIDGEELTALLPKPNDFETMKYFKD